MTVVKSKRMMHNKFKRGSYIRLVAKEPIGWSKFPKDVQTQAFQLVGVLKVMGVQQKTGEYLLRSISEPNHKIVLRELIAIIDEIYVQDESIDPEFYKTLYSKD